MFWIEAKLDKTTYRLKATEMSGHELLITVRETYAVEKRYQNENQLHESNIFPCKPNSIYLVCSGKNESHKKNGNEQRCFVYFSSTKKLSNFL